MMNAKKKKTVSSVALGGILLFLSLPSLAVTPEQVKKLTAEGDEETNAYFGWSVDIDNDTAVVGANRETVGSIQRAGAAYVFTRSGEAGDWTRQAKFVAFDAGWGDQFGHQVAVSGDTIVVGAFFDDAPLTNTGSAYVFVRSGDTWSLQEKIVPPGAEENDRWASAIALNGDTLFLGGPLDDYDIDNDSVVEPDAGSVYIFTRSSGVWSEAGILRPSDAAANQQFGVALSVSGDSILVTARNDDDIATDAGAAYVFTRSGNNWVEEAKLTAAESVADEQVGNRGALSGDTAILGSPKGRLGETGNTAFVFVRNELGWTQQAILTGSEPNDAHFFGVVDVFGDTAVIGADNDEENGISSGAAYVFKRSGEVWTEESKFFADDASSDEWFGAQIAMSGDTVIISAPTNLFRPGGFPLGSGPGSAYVFSLNSGETPAGSDVEVTPVPVDENGDPIEDLPAIDMNFDNVAVDGDGETTVTVTDSGPPPPDGFKLTGLRGGATYLDIETSAVFSGSVEICIDYSNLNVAGNPSNLAFYHYEEVGTDVFKWVDITSSNDLDNQVLCGITESFSFFAVMETEDPGDLLSQLVDAVANLNASKGIINSFDAKLDAAKQALADTNENNDVAAMNILLNAFINAVEAQRGKKLTDEEADDLVGRAEEIALVLSIAEF